MRKHVFTRSILAMIMILAMLLSTACSVVLPSSLGNGQESGDRKDAKPGDKKDEKSQDKEGTGNVEYVDGKYPRYTGFDDRTDDSNKLLALTQNCRVKFKFSFPYGDVGEHYLEGESCCCYGCEYYRTYSDETARDIMTGSKADVPDVHRAIIRKDGKETIYDFCNHVVAEGEYSVGVVEHDEAMYLTIQNDSGLLTKNGDAKSYLADDHTPMYSHAIDSLPDTVCCGITCPGSEWKEVQGEYFAELTGITHTQYKLWVDPATNLVLKGAKYTYGSVLEKEDTLWATFEVTDFGINCVTPEDVEAIAMSLYKGHEDEFKKVDTIDYWEGNY